MAILKVRDNNGNVTVIPALEGRSAYRIAVDNGFIGTEQEWLESLKGGTSLVGTKDYWNNNNIIPKLGELVIITDYTIKNENNKEIKIPGIKVGDGINYINDLPVVSSDSASKLSHTITIGNKVFDGSEDVVIDIYDGEYDEELLLMLNSFEELDTPEQNQMTLLNNENQMTLLDNSEQMTMISELLQMN